MQSIIFTETDTLIIRMKKFFISASLFGSLLFCMSSCRSSREVLNLSALNGPWEITEINGAAIVTNTKTPTLFFDATKGKITGFTGCNKIMGSFETNSKPGQIDLSNLGSTRMACPDMTTERNVLNTLALVKKYMQIENNNIALCNEQNRPIMILEKAAKSADIHDLEGEWTITTIAGEPVSEKNEQEPMIGFNTQEQKVYGCAGCNNFHGNYHTEKGKNASIAFPALGTTMMLCRDMDNEQKILESLNKVRSFKRLSDEEIAFYDADSKQLLTLKKK